MLFWMSYVHWFMVLLKYLFSNFLAVWYVDSSIHIDNFIFLPCLSIFLFQFLAYFLFFHSIPLYLFQYSGFFILFWFLPWFVYLSTLYLWTSIHLYCLPWYRCGPSLIKCWLSCLSFQECVIVQNHSPVISSTASLVVH